MICLFLWRKRTKIFIKRNFRSCHLKARHKIFLWCDWCFIFFLLPFYWCKCKKTSLFFFGSKSFYFFSKCKNHKSPYKNFLREKEDWERYKRLNKIKFQQNEKNTLIYNRVFADPRDFLIRSRAIFLNTFVVSMTSQCIHIFLARILCCHSFSGPACVLHSYYFWTGMCVLSNELSMHSYFFWQACIVKWLLQAFTFFLDRHVCCQVVFCVSEMSILTNYRPLCPLIIAWGGDKLPLVKSAPKNHPLPVVLLKGASVIKKWHKSFLFFAFLNTQSKWSILYFFIVP